jgi:sporulation protein YlmC with PRC-barrel domain
VTTVPDRLDGPWLDAALRLLDRQVVDTDGRMVCNVDDLELTENQQGALAVTGLLVGPDALVPRLSGRLGSWLREMWVALGVQYADRDVPLRLGLDLVESIGSDVRLRVHREGLLDRQPAAAPGLRHRRLDHLLGQEVRVDGRPAGEVLDVRLEPRLAEGSLPVRSLVVGRGRPGSLLGYDRGSVDGPWLVSAVVRALHRHTGELPIEAVDRIDWDAGAVFAHGPLRPLGRGGQGA